MPYRLLLTDQAKPVLAFIGASFSWISARFANAALPADVGTWIETGGMVALVGCLIYGITTLWKNRAEERKAMAEEREALLKRLDDKDKVIAALNAEFRNDWKNQVERLANALDRAEERHGG